MSKSALKPHDRRYIGGGNIAAVVGLSPFQTPLRAWHGIMGTSPEIEKETLDFFERRKAVEPFAAVVLKQRGFKVVKQNVRYDDGEYPFFKAEIDAEVLDGRDPWNVEFKSVHPMATRGWGADGSNEFPDYVNCQIQWGLGVRKADRAFAAAIIGFDEDRMYPTPADENLIAALRARALEWWQKYVEGNTPPPVTTVSDILQFVKADPAKVMAAEDYGMVSAVNELVALRKAVKTTEGQYAALLDSIKLQMVDATVLTVQGKAVATWTQNKESKTTHWKSLALSFNPSDDIIEEYEETKPGPRVWRFKDSK